MRSPVTLVWTGTVGVGIVLAALLTYGGYRADALGTSGSPGLIELLLLAVFGVLLTTASVLTVRRHRSSSLPPRRARR
jgi:uncharacterized membrane protein YedE/YeeE